MKIITVISFLIFIIIFPIINLSTEDKNFSEVENKILTKFPKISIESIYDTEFMNEFDKYVTDQFPYRDSFLEIKNTYNKTLGHKEFRNIYLCNDMLLEKFLFNKSNIDKNISQVISISDNIKHNFDINSTLMLIPTSTEIYNENLPNYAINDSQKNAINYIYKSYSNPNLSVYSPINILKQYKDEYIYFKTDHHWTQLGAYITYLDMFNKDFDTNVVKTYNKVSDSFLGTYYSKVLLPNIEADSIYSFEYFNNHSIDIDFSDSFNTLYDKDALYKKNKYQYFLHGDPAFAVIEGNLNSNKEVLIFKDSYAHSFIPFLTDDYRKIHVVDPRYYDIDLDTYLSKNNISYVIFLHNIQSLNNSIIYK